MGALVYFALWAGLFFVMMRFGCGAHVMGHRQGHRDAHGKDMPDNPDRLHWVPPEMDVDPVCGKTVHTANAKSSVHDGMVYYFCSHECREEFEAAPQLYAGSTKNQDSMEMEHANG